MDQTFHQPIKLEVVEAVVVVDTLAPTFTMVVPADFTALVAEEHRILAEVTEESALLEFVSSSMCLS